MVQLKLLIYCAALMVLGCGKNSKGISIDSPRIEVLKKIYSPDKTKLALLYKLENSEKQSKQLNVSILSPEDTITNVYKNVLPCFHYTKINSCSFDQSAFLNFEPLKWANNRRLVVQIDSRLFARAGFPFVTKTISIYGIELEIHSKYSKETNEPLINHYELSPNKSKLLVFYRNQGLNDENVSAIDYNSNLPLYGNIYTSENPSWDQYDIIQFGRWKEEVIQIAKIEFTAYGLNRKLNTKIELTKEFSICDSLDVSEFKNSITSDKRMYEHLKKTGQETIGVITSIYFNSHNEAIVATYEYRYIANGQAFQSKFVVKSKYSPKYEFELGDKIPILFDRNQPIIHRTLTNYSH